MNLHDGDEAGVQIVGLGFFGVKNLNWIRSSWDGEDGRFVEILRELDGVQRGRSYDQLHVCALLYRLKPNEGSEQFSLVTTFTSTIRSFVLGSHLLEETKQDVSVDRPLVGLVQHDDGVLAQFRVDQTLPQQHTVRHVLDDRLGTSAVLKPDGITHLQKTQPISCSEIQQISGGSIKMVAETHFLSQTAAVLLRDSLGDGHGGDTTGLRAADLPSGGVTCFCQVLRDLRGLTRARLSNDDENLVVVNSLQQISRRRI